MSGIVHIDGKAVPWFEYGAADGAPAPIRVKALTARQVGVPPMQYVEYAPGHTDPVHHHDTDEFFIVTDGEIRLASDWHGAGSVVFVPKDTDYAVEAGPEGARYYRVVV